MAEEDVARFPYKLIRDPFNELITTTYNLLDREWPAHYAGLKDSQMILMQYFGLAVTHFRTISFVCADVDDGAVRSPRFALSVPPINRAILEIVFSVVYLLENLPEHTKHYYRAAWRAEQESLQRHLEHYQKRHRGTGKPRWDAYINTKTKKLAEMESIMKITPAEKANLNLIPRWPKMRQLRLRLRNSPTMLSYLEYLDDWFYDQLSSYSHGEPMGVGQMGLHFLGTEELKAIAREDHEGVERKLDEKIVEFRTTQVWMAITLIMSLISEIQVNFYYDILKERLLYVWTVINEYSDISREMYEERYESLLSS
jgi:hypothetical protein